MCGWARELGFARVGVADVDLATAEPGLLAWLNNGFHGGMDYMAAHGLKLAEWPEKAADLLPPADLSLHLQVQADEARAVRLCAHTPLGAQLLREVTA